MRYRVVFEFQSEDSAMSDVYNCRDEQQAQEKFAELRDSLQHAIDPSTSVITDESALYSVIDRKEGIFGYVRLLEE